MTGVALVGLISSGALGEEEKAELDNTKIAVKLAIVLVIAVLAFVGKKKPAPQVGALGDDRPAHARERGHRRLLVAARSRSAEG